MKRLSLAIRTLAALAAISALPYAQASLVGDTVTCAATAVTPPPIKCSLASAVVGAGTEFTVLEDGGVPLLFADFGASSITLTSAQQAAQVSFYFGDLLSFGSLDDFLAPAAVLAAVSLSGISGVSGLAIGDLSFTDHSLTINLSDAVFNAGSTATINLSFRATSVPEPTGIALAAIALVGLAATRRGRA